MSLQDEEIKAQNDRDVAQANVAAAYAQRSGVDIGAQNRARVAAGLPPLPLEPLPGTSLHNLDAAGAGSLQVSDADYATGLSPETLSFDASEHMDPPRSSRSDGIKAHLRAVLAAQPYRGEAVHKDDLLAALYALIDGEGTEINTVRHGVETPAKLRVA